MDFKDKLKDIRAKAGLSQEALADKIGVSRQAITKCTTGALGGKRGRAFLILKI